VNIFQKLHVGVQLFSVLKLWIEGLFPYYNIRRFLRQRKTTITVQVKLSCVTSSQGKGNGKFRYYQNSNRKMVILTTFC